MISNQLIWAYEKENKPTIARLANRMGTSEYQARKTKKLATEKGLISNGDLTALGQLIAKNLNSQIIQDYLSGKVTKKTVAALSYNIKYGSTHNIPRLANRLRITIRKLMPLLYFAESKEWLGINQIADLNNISFRNDWDAEDALDAALSI